MATLAWVARAAIGLELVGRPVMRLVVVDVEQPEELLAIEQRGGAQRIEALLDDRCPDVVAARIVAVVDGEDRPASGHGRRRQRPRRDPADGREVGAGQSAAHLDRRIAVLALDEHAPRDRPRTGPSRGRPGRPGCGRDRAGCRCRWRPGAGPPRDGADAPPPRRAGRRSRSHPGHRPPPGRSRRRGCPATRGSRRRCAGHPMARAVPGSPPPAPDGRRAGRPGPRRPVSRRAARRASASAPIRPRPAASSSARPTIPNRRRDGRRGGCGRISSASARARTDSCPCWASQTATR